MAMFERSRLGVIEVARTIRLDPHSQVHWDRMLKSAAGGRSLQALELWMLPHGQWKPVGYVVLIWAGVSRLPASYETGLLWSRFLCVSQATLFTSCGGGEAPQGAQRSGSVGLGWPIRRGEITGVRLVAAEP